MKVYFASDHAGFEIKNQLLAFVRDELGMEVEDCGAFELNKDDDYPAIMANAARKLAADEHAGLDNRGIIAGASGQGEAIVANRFKGVRCALYYGKASKDQTDITGRTLDIIASVREHNNANMLSLGLRFMDFDEAKEVVRMFLSTPFPAEERHARRVKQIDEQA